MISYEEALDILRANAAPLRQRTVPLAAAAGEVAAATVGARLTVPCFANAAMDGYVLRAGATTTASPATPVRLPVAGMIAAGSAPPDTGGPGHSGEQAWEILTGAPVPGTLDAVVPVERLRRLEARDGQPPGVEITSPLQPGQNVRRAGEDFVIGQLVVAAGTRLSPHHLMGLAACGIDEVDVAGRPRVAVLTTGSELESQGTELAPGRIRDANGPYLRALLPLLGVDLVELTTAPDDDTLRDRLHQLAGKADLVLTTGGVSAGRLDLLPAAVREIGGEVLFHKVAIRPGKPLLHARLPGGALLFGLPGNPLAVAVGMRFFVIPALRLLQGLKPERPTPAMTTEVVRARGQLRFLAKALADVDGSGQRRVRLLPGQESFRIAPLLQANCWAIVPEGVGEIPAGGMLQTLPLYPDDSSDPLPPVGAASAATDRTP